MTSKTLAELLIDLGVSRSHSRPHVSNDHAFSEAQFKTVKYRPDFPESFGPIQDARAPTSHSCFGGTTTSTVTPESVYSRRRTSTTVVRRR